MEATEGLYLTDIFHNKSEVRELTEAWRKNYNEERPHEALDNMTPFEYREELINERKQYDRCSDKRR